MSVRPTLKSTLTIYFLMAACLPLMLAGTAFLHFFSVTLKKEVTDRNFLVARSMAGEVNRFLSDYRSLLEYTAEQAGDVSLQTSSAPDSRFDAIFLKYSLFESLKLLNTKGVIRTLMPFREDQIGQDMSGYPFIQKAMSSNTAVWSDVYLSPRSGHLAISLAVPSSSGIVVGDMNLTVLQDITQEIRGVNGAYAEMVDRDGTVVANPDPVLVNQRVNINNIPMVQQGLAGREGSFRYRFEGEYQIGSVAVVPQTGWLLIVVQPENKAFVVINQGKWLLWMVIVVIAIVALVVSGFFLRKAVSPLMRLTDMTRKISCGDYHIENFPAGYPEIERLAGDFKFMAEAVNAREIELRQSREQVRRSEKRLRDIYDSVSDFIYTQDMDGRLLSANRAMADLFEYSSEELVGHVVSDFMKPALRYLFEVEYLGHLMTTGQHHGVFVCYTRTGRKIYIDYVSTVIRSDDGDVFISGIGRNVTERMVAERALREKEDWIRTILETTPIPIAVCDAVGGLQFINSAFTAVFGWTLDELRGQPMPHGTGGGDAMATDEHVMKKIPQMCRSGEACALETRQETKDGRLLDILIAAAPIQGSHEKPSGMVLSLMDLTEKKKMEAGLLHAQKMEAIGTLAGGVAHDFNNLMMAIQGNISLMLLDTGLSEAVSRRLRDIEHFVQQGASLTRQLLGFAKGGKYEIRPVNLNQLLKEYHEIFSRTRKDIRIHEDYDAALWNVAVDSDQIGQVLMNLYINAAHAMSPGGDAGTEPQGDNTIRVRTKNIWVKDSAAYPFEIRPGRYIHLSVADTGVGMDEATRRRIFEPFFTTREMGRGTGLGLASVYGIIKNHGGCIDVQSQPGKGTVFHIYLPAVEFSAQSPEHSDGVAVSLYHDGLVLLVDDEDMILEVGRQMLERTGWQVCTASNAHDAIAVFTKRHAEISLIILDMIMPEIGGGVVFDQLKAIDPDVNVLLSSGYSIDGQAQAILERGCRGFLQKPFNLQELNQKIDEILAVK